MSAVPVSLDGLRLTQQLRAVLPADAVIDDVAHRRACSTDLLAPGATCALVVRPPSVESLRRAVAIVSAAGFAIIPRGAGLTYVGGYAPPHERVVVVDLAALNRIVEINPDDMYVTVEAGVTWRQVYEALKPHGLRLPYFGTFSGRRATIGGGLSNGALFFGTARYGSAADIVLGLGVVLADGTLLPTGQAAVANAKKPFFRAYGPDLTGVFVHDSGAFGIKATATLRVIRAPAVTDYLSFTFATADDAVAALSELSRAEVAEEAYAMDPVKTRDLLQSRGLTQDLRVLGRVIAQENNPLRGLVSGAKLALAGRRFADRDVWSVHVVCAGRSRAVVADDLRRARAIAVRFRGAEIANSMPKAARADLFPELRAVVGANGERWVALNAKVAHSDAPALVRAAEAVFTRARDEMQRLGVTNSCLLTVMSNHAFSYEPVFHWKDRWLPVHRQTLAAAGVEAPAEPAANAPATELVMRLRSELIALFHEHGAASSQIGRSYPYFAALRPETQAFVRGLKRLTDPDGRMNPGVLQL